MRFFALEPDCVHIVTWLPGTCRNCGEPAGELQMVRCSWCEKLAFPKLTLFCGCGNCGGAGQAIQLWTLHVNEEHGVENPTVGSSSAPRSPLGPPTSPVLPEMGTRFRR